MFDCRLVHIMDQRELRRGEGPIALVLVPTRELALQIYTETKRYCKVLASHRGSSQGVVK